MMRVMKWNGIEMNGKDKCAIAAAEEIISESNEIDDQQIPKPGASFFSSHFHPFHAELSKDGNSVTVEHGQPNTIAAVRVLHGHGFGKELDVVWNHVLWTSTW